MHLKNEHTLLGWWKDGMCGLLCAVIYTRSIWR